MLHNRHARRVCRSAAPSRAQRANLSPSSGSTDPVSAPLKSTGQVTYSAQKERMPRCEKLHRRPRALLARRWLGRFERMLCRGASLLTGTSQEEQTLHSQAATRSQDPPQRPAMTRAKVMRARVAMATTLRLPRTTTARGRPRGRRRGRRRLRGRRRGRRRLRAWKALVPFPSRSRRSSASPQRQPGAAGPARSQVRTPCKSVRYPWHR
jgi:hypothetical protein